MKSHVYLLSVAFILFWPTGAQAYVGPGLGAGTLAVILGFLGSIILAVFAVLWYPVKRIIRKLRGTKRGE